MLIQVDCENRVLVRATEFLYRKVKNISDEHCRALSREQQRRQEKNRERE